MQANTAMACSNIPAGGQAGWLLFGEEKGKYNHLDQRVADSDLKSWPNWQAGRRRLSNLQPDRGNVSACADHHRPNDCSNPSLLVSPVCGEGSVYY